MSGPTNAPLPVAHNNYDPHNEQVFRSTVGDELTSISDRVLRNEEKKSKPGSLALRRFQFMFMGGGNV